MISWADLARKNSPKPAPAQPAIAVAMIDGLSEGAAGCTTSTTTSSTSSPPPDTVVIRGEGMVRTKVGHMATDMWSLILSYCPFTTVLRVGHTCVSLRNLSMKPSLWYTIREQFTFQYEMDVGHAAPAVMEFGFPVDMSGTVTRKKGSAAFPATTIVDSSNETAADFIRYARFLMKSEHRMWHLTELRADFAPVQDEALRLGFVASYDDSLPSPAMGIPLSIMAVERSTPFLKPSEISTVFSHLAANAMGACRFAAIDVTNSYTDLFLQRLGRTLGAASLHKAIKRTLVSAALIEISLPEAVQCLKRYPRGGETMEMLLGEVTIDENETKYFAIRQLSSEAHIAIVFVDPILTMVIGVGPVQY